MRSKSEVAKVVLAAAFLFLLLGVAPGFAQVAGLSAPGQPYVDCIDAAARHQRLASGLDVQRRAIDREQALLDALVEERKTGTAEARDQLKARAAEELKSQAEEALENLVEAREALERNPGNTLTADFLKWKKSVSAVQERVEQLLALRDSFAAGYSYTTEIQARSHDVLGHLREANKLFVDSGLAEAVGGKLAAACGPAGVAAFEGSLFLMDQLALDMGNWDRLLEEQRAADNLNRMRWGLSEVEQKMDSLVEGCPAQFGKDTGTQPPATASTSLTPPLPEPPVPQAPAASASKKSGGKSSKLLLGVVGGVALAGAAVYAGSAMADLAALSAGACVSSRFCIVNVMSSGCSCSGSVNGGCDWTGPTAGSGEACGSGTPCASGLSCNNGRCEGPSGRCPF
jgi:hypothetical protein